MSEAPNALPPFDLRKPGDVQAVIRYESQRRWPDEFREWHTTWEGVSKVLSEGVSLYQLALALQHLVRNWEGERDIRHLMAFPVINAGLSYVAADRWRAEWLYKRLFVEGTEHLDRYDFWLDRLEDAGRVQNWPDLRLAEDKLKDIIKHAKSRRARA